jgi:hypothetical protein
MENEEKIGPENGCKTTVKITCNFCDRAFYSYFRHLCVLEMIIISTSSHSFSFLQIESKFKIIEHCILLNVKEIL